MGEEQEKIRANKKISTDNIDKSNLEIKKTKESLTVPNDNKHKNLNLKLEITTNIGEKDESISKKRQKKFSFSNKETSTSSDVNIKQKKKRFVLNKNSDNKRRNSKFTISQALYMQDEEDSKRQRSMASIKRAR